MNPRKNNSPVRSAEATPAMNAVERLRAWITKLRAQRNLPPLRMPKPTKLHVPRPSWLSSLWSARLAVRSGVPIDAYLQYRLAHHLAEVTVPHARLPLALSVDSFGSVVSVPRASSPASPRVDAFLRTTGPAALSSEILLGQGEVARLAAQIESQRRRVDELAEEVTAATRGVQLVDPSDDAQAQQMGRPGVPPPVGLGLRLFALALLLAESWQLAVPCFEVAGIRTSQLAVELQRDMVGVVMGCVFAIGAAATLFLLAHFILQRLLDPQDPQLAHGRVWAAVTSAIATGILLALAWSIAALRPGTDQAVDVNYARTTLFLVLLAMPFTGAWLLGLARHGERARAHARALARAWDVEHYLTLAEYARRAEALGEAERLLSHLEAERNAIVRRIQLLQRRSAAAGRLAADALAEDEQELAEAAQRILAALQLDRYEYIRHACARGIRIPRPEVGAGGAAVTVPAVLPGAAAARSQRDPEHNLGLAG